MGGVACCEGDFARNEYKIARIYVKVARIGFKDARNDRTFLL